ncbi:MAG: hypothetical protein A3J74_00355 [Elusimicrobia bacterium RIFCSPHIGHO2_02_FULL_57_9]|nr:MAG: hypothetical protein A3J74_00355 [Elusimicrobia bacterium RIFCSPHIGHO2_02_FULL_57_9]
MRQALGRGLDALIPKGLEKGGESHSGEALRVSIEKIRPNHLQPRRSFDPIKLSELASSIKQHGMAQPLVVSYDNVSKSYELIAGERRLRAAELAGLKEIEVVVRAPGSDKQRLILAMIENLQREDLNPIEEALGYLRLMKEFQITQTQLGHVLGKSKSAVSNTLRLLDLPDEIQKSLQNGRLTEGHARAILMVDDPTEKHRLFRMIVEHRLSVREAEDYARKTAEGANLEVEAKKLAPPAQEKPADIISLENSLQQFLGTKVEIKTKKDPSRGYIVLHYYSLTDFDKIIKMLKK